jgi:hypothetical protein
MKFLAIILSVYFLGLNFVPCEDTPMEMEKVETEISEVITLNKVTAGSVDDCSPFCQCHCCHIHVARFDGTYYPLLEPEISTSILLTGGIIGQEFPDDHFQPPRI